MRNPFLKENRVSNRGSYSALASSLHMCTRAQTNLCTNNVTHKKEKVLWLAVGHFTEREPSSVHLVFKHLQPNPTGIAGQWVALSQNSKWLVFEEWQPRLTDTWPPHACPYMYTCIYMHSKTHARTYAYRLTRPLFHIWTSLTSGCIKQYVASFLALPCCSCTK